MKNFSPRQVAAIVLIIALIMNITTFALGKISDLAFWGIIIAILGIAYFAGLLKKKFAN